MQGQKGSKRIEMSEFTLTVVHFARPIRKPDGMRVDLPLDKKTVENQDRASGPPGCRGPWAAGLLLAKPLKTWLELFSS